MRRVLCWILILALALCAYYYHGASESNYAKGYAKGLTDGWNQFLNNDFEDYWEDWLIQEYDVTEQELRAVLDASIDAVTPSPAPTSVPTVSPTPAPTAFGVGTQGDDVLKLQKQLTALGYSCGTPDGIYGQMTASAVTDFQKVVGLNATGIADANTVKVLYLSNAPTARPKPTLPPEYWSTSTPTPKPTVRVTPKPTATPEPTVRYIGNRSTGKFHHTWCASVGLMDSANKVYFYERDEATSRGYVACRRCHP